MFSRLRTTWMAGSGALLLVLVLAGGALGATVLTAATTPESETEPSVAETLATFEDLDGDGIDDDCDEVVVGDAEAAAAAQAAVDTDGDGTISVPEAAHSDRVGGPNCNHGGYVSQVAHDQDDEDCEAPTEVTDPVEPIATPTDTPVVEVVAELDEEQDEAAPAACEPEDEAEEAVEDAAAEAECEATEVPPFDPATQSFGAYVSSVAQSDAVGGKNCNHGGAVSEAVKAAKEAAREAREAAKAERAVERAAAKAERQAKREAAKAERAAKKAERAAAKAAKSHGKGNPHGGD